MAVAIVWLTRSTFEQPFGAQIGDQRGDVAVDRAALVVELVLEPLADGRLVRAGLDLAHDRGCGRIERVDLLGPGLEQDAAELFLAELDVFRKMHGTLRCPRGLRNRGLQSMIRQPDPGCSFGKTGASAGIASPSSSARRTKASTIESVMRSNTGLARRPRMSPANS